MYQKGKLTLLANGADVCYVKLKKRRYLDKCRLSAPAGISGPKSKSLYRSTAAHPNLDVCQAFKQKIGIYEIFQSKGKAETVGRRNGNNKQIINLSDILF